MKNLRTELGALLVIGSAILAAPPLVAQDAPPVDTALIVSVDVSNSVDDARYKLQMEGIAKALEDPGVIDAITGGSNGGILFSMVTWSEPRPLWCLGCGSRAKPMRLRSPGACARCRIRAASSRA